MAHLWTAWHLNPPAIHLIKNNTINYEQRYQDMGSEGEEEVAGRKVNDDLKPENILKEGGLLKCVHKFKCASADLSDICSLRERVGGEYQCEFIFSGLFYAVNTTEMEICAHMMDKRLTRGPKVTQKKWRGIRSRFKKTAKLFYFSIRLCWYTCGPTAEPKFFQVKHVYSFVTRRFI